MRAIEQVFFEAVLADIAYVDGLASGLTDDLLAIKIQDRISKPLAQTIGTRFEVLAVGSGSLSGYQGIISRDKQTKRSLRCKSWYSIIA